MKSETRLDSVVFQLTPTRTRYDLVLSRNGKAEKIASGLLDPFLAHLKTAQDQIAKGGYSIRLEPDPGTDTLWFTKGTVERFIRYVSTPEVLERVNTLELEILQIKEAIAIQGNDNFGLSTVEDHQSRWKGCIEGSKSAYDGDTEKAMVLYKHRSRQHLSDGSTMQEENSRFAQENLGLHQLLRVLENRKTVLWKEQGMAFACAVAAGFDMDHMANLILFAKSFGASRLLEACLRFMELWKTKHKTGQWLEIVGVEAMSFQSEFSSVKASGIILSGDTRKQKEFAESNGKDDNITDANISSQQLNSDHNRDTRSPLDRQVPLGPQYYHGQIQNPMFPQWQTHSLPGPPVSQSYPMQGTPYYRNYLGSGPSFQSPYPPMEDPRFNTTQMMGFKRHSMDSKESNIESKTWEMGISSTMSQDGVDQNGSEFEKGSSQGWESHKKVGRSGKRQSAAVVVQNINYITSKRHEKSASESQSASDAETEEEIQVLQSDAPDRKHKNSSRSLKKNGGLIKSIKTSNADDKDQVVYRQEKDAGNWEAFQNLLLRVQKENTSTVDRDLFSSAKEPAVKRRLNKSRADSVVPPKRDKGDSVNGNACRLKQVASVDELLIPSEGKGFKGYQLNAQFTEIEGGERGYRKTENNDFMICGPMKQVSSKSSSDPIAENEYENVCNLNKSSLYDVTDESFIVPFRSGLHDELATDKKTIIYINSDLPSALQKSKDYSNRTKNQHSYEPLDLSIMPERGLEKGSIGFDPAKDFDMQIPFRNAGKIETRSQESKLTREELKRSEKERKSSAAQYGIEKRKMDAITRKGKSSNLNPLAEAKARAEKLRAFKADLQKAKKEKEEEEIKRLEALKRERQKRIAARSSSNIAQSPLNAQLTKAQKLTRVSPSSYISSKFSDSAPASSSPLQKLPRSSTNIAQSPLNPQQNRPQKTTTLSPSSYKGSKFSDTAPTSSSPLQKFPRRSNVVAQSTRNPQETTARKPTRLSPSSYKGPKFSDTVPAFSSPLQKLPTRTTSAASTDSHKIIKTNRLNGSAHLFKNGSRRSLTSVPELKKESNSLIPEAKAACIQSKRVSDPKDSNIHRASSLRSVSSNQVPKKTMPNEPQVKKTSAVLHLDKTKSTTLPKDKVRTLNGPSEKIHKNSAMKETVGRTGSKTSLTSKSMHAKTSNEVALTLSNNNDDPIIEKAVVMLENESIPAPVVRASEEMMDIGVRSCGDGRRVKTALVSEYAVHRAPPSPLDVDEVEGPSECKLDKQPSSYEVVNHPTDVSQRFSNSPVTDKPYQAPFAGATSLEEPPANNVEHIEEHIDYEVATMRSESMEAHDSNSVDSSSVYKKPHSKESSKGFRELLKFRRRGQSSASGELNSNGLAVDVCTVAMASNDVPTLKDLISQDSCTGGTSPKVSRHFSLFSPFQTKTSEKKAAA